MSPSAPGPCEWRNTAHILAANGVPLTIDFHVADAIHVQTLAKQPRSGFLHVERIAHRPERIGKFEQEGISLFTRASRLLAARRVDERPDETDDVSLRVEFRSRLAKNPPDAAVGPSTAEVGLPRRPGVQRRLDLARNRLAVVGVDRPFPAELPGVFGRETGQVRDSFADREAAAVEVGSENAYRQRVRGNQESWIMTHRCGV